MMMVVGKVIRLVGKKLGNAIRLLIQVESWINNYYRGVRIRIRIRIRDARWLLRRIGRNNAVVAGWKGKGEGMGWWLSEGRGEEMRWWMDGNGGGVW